MTDETVFETQYGKFSISPTTDQRSFERFKRGVYVQSDDIELLKHFITPQSVVVDVGAHIGTMTVPFAKAAKEVFAFEPVPTTREYLEKNIALNSLTNVTVFPFALGSADAESFIAVTSPIDSGQNSVSLHGDIPIHIRRLDENVEHADLVKIDAEGLECDVLAGGSELIRRSHPVIFCEINYGQLWEHGGSPTKVARILRRAGYQLYIPLGANMLGRVWSLPFVTALLHPAFLFRMSRNYAFDIIAATPVELPHDLEMLSRFSTLGEIARKKFWPRVARMLLLKK